MNSQGLTSGSACEWEQNKINLSLASWRLKVVLACLGLTPNPIAKHWFWLDDVNWKKSTRVRYRSPHAKWQVGVLIRIFSKGNDELKNWRLFKKISDHIPRYPGPSRVFSLNVYQRMNQQFKIITSSSNLCEYFFFSKINLTKF